MDNSHDIQGEIELRKKLKNFSYNSKQGIELSDAHVDYLLALFTSELEVIEIQHSKELYRAVKDELLDMFPDALNWEDNIKGVGIRRFEIYDRIQALSAGDET